MVYTMITLYDDKLVVHYVGVVATAESLADTAKREIANRFEAYIHNTDDQAHGENGRTIGFREIQMHIDPSQPLDLVNVWENQ